MDVRLKKHSTFIKDCNKDFSTSQVLVAHSSTVLVKEMYRVTDARRALRHVCIYCVELFVSIKVFEKVMWSFILAFLRFLKTSHSRSSITTIYCTRAPDDKFFSVTKIRREAERQGVDNHCSRLIFCKVFNLGTW